MQIVVERIDLRRGDIRVRREIGLRVEACRRIAAFLPPERLVVLQRIDARGRHVGIVRQIAAVSKNAFGLRPSCQPKVL